MHSPKACGSLSLRRSVDESLVATVIAAAVGVQPPSNRPLLETLHTYFRHRRVLLLMDNCEHVIDEAARIAESLLSVCPGLHILATSRESLRVPGEQAFRLPSLDTPPLEPNGRLGAQQAVSYAAVALFADRARSVNHRFAVDDETAPAIAQICRRLDGIPLAIELAAARVTILPLTTLLKKLDERFALLTDGARTALPRQQTMRAAIDWSYGLLSESEQVIFERLAVFVGGCTLETAAAVSQLARTPTSRSCSKRSRPSSTSRSSSPICKPRSRHIGSWSRTANTDVKDSRRGANWML